ncbi:hypothetical protein [Nocardioides euryhalodurans]|uniref:hypothetical protein n=1 Tax=Nocardioides euryhalodurans TaxID=2518370 RepID=UPI00141E1D28|nr:hypothetical protein [Nocardioides euryhalodurans]
MASRDRETAPRQASRPVPVAAAPAPPEPPAEPMVQPAVEPEPESRWRLRALAALWLLLTAAGLAALVAGIVPWGPERLPEVGAVVVATTYVWALAARTGGRPVVFGALTLAVGIAVLVSDHEVLRNGAAVMTCAVSAILAVVATVPAVTARVAVREVLVAVLVAAGGGLATAGLEPTTAFLRFEYVTLAMALVGCLVVVYRLGAGLHGLGRRGLFIVVFGGVVLALTLAYGELLRRYGAASLVQGVDEGIVWLRERAGASPRPIVAVLGVPALFWGVHMRARRRQGWWVCAFGVAATTPIAQVLVDPDVPWPEAELALAYGVVVGLVLGFVLIRADLAFTGGRSTRGRRGRRAEEAAALRPEPSRIDPLL